MSADVPSKEAARLEAAIQNGYRFSGENGDRCFVPADFAKQLLAELAPLRARIEELEAQAERLNTLWNASDRDKASVMELLHKRTEERDAFEQRITTLRTAANQAAKALEAVMSIYAIPPQTPAESENFDRGAPLTKRQVYAMQLAHNALRAAWVSGEEPKQ